ncbi:caspase family protein [Rhizobacter sp. J219]|uniref:caspase family protein n=1 Tax=Rhizobacter sp. J219 TaxID=2898430 RepID=UPI0021511DD6|nr:caspase family protein [Rhizobacter sp. J219]MCR5885537.1 caspase family protein [Rhizobacter sp. J219]
MSHRTRAKTKACHWMAACVLVSMPAVALSPAELRVALVIGNAAYAAAPLLNPLNDARAMGEALKGMGFSVVEVRDAKKAEMEQAITQVRDQLKDRRGVGLLYYAGHGLQLDWRNYMVPVDAKLASAQDVRQQAVDVQQVVDAFKSAGNRMNIVVLDACRDNPFGATGSAKGLAQMDAPPGTLLAYATAPGNVAEDGDAKTGNGLYTQHLVKELQQPGARIEDVFKRVRLQVRRSSEGRQVPWESTSLEDDFSFDPKAAVRAREVEDLRKVEAALLREKADWDRIKGSTRPDDFYAYLQKYPSGLISEQAQFRLEQLQRTQVRAQPNAQGVIPLPAGVNRFELGDELVYDVVDGFSGVARRLTQRVTFADADRVEINHGAQILDQMGSVLKNSRGVKDPGILMVPSDLALGKRWRSAFTNTVEGQPPATNFYEFRVAAFEEVTVPAGTFKAYRIERRGESSLPGVATTFMGGTMWIEPTTMTLVRNDISMTQNSRPTDRESLRLVAVRRVPRRGG